MAAGAADVHDRGRRRPGRRRATGRHVLGDVGRLLAAAIAPLWEDAMSTLVTGIGELVTNDPTRGRRPAGARAATPRSSSSDGRVAWVGPAAAAPAADDADRRRRPGRDPRLRRQPRPPGLRRRPGRRSSRRGCRAPVRRRRDRARTVAATRAASDDELRDRLRALLAEMRAPGHDDRGGEERLRAHRRGRGALRCAWPPRSRRRRRSSARTSSRPEYAGRAGRVRRPGHRPDARRLRAARPVGRRLLRAGLGARVRRRPGPRGAGGRRGGGTRPAGARQPARRRARACGSPSSSVPRAPTTART